MSDFFTSLSSNHSVLWMLLVMGSVATASLSLYFTWETVIRLVRRTRARRRQSGGR